MAVYVTNFEIWAKEWYYQYLKDKLTNRELFWCVPNTCSYNNKSPYTVVGDAKTGKIATAKRRTNEKHDVQIGIGVAYAKYCGVEIPMERK